MVRVKTPFPHLQTYPGPKIFRRLERDPAQRELDHLQSVQTEPKHKEPGGPQEFLWIGSL